MNHDAFLSQAASRMQESAIRKMGTVGARIPDLISFAAGFPAPDLFAWPEFREIASELLSGRDGHVLQYGATRGYWPLLEALPDILLERDIRGTTIDELLVTTGSQQALDLLSRILFDPGDVILVELPTYSGAITAFNNAQARMVGVRQDADGINLDHLDEVLVRERRAGRRATCLYVTPNFQNPSGLLLALSKRRQLLEWAARRDVLIVEDDPYGALYFDESGAALTRPIKADDEEGRVVYLSSFSKTLAPGFRVAWIVAAPVISSKVEVVKQATDLCTGVLDQRIVHQAWSRGVLTRRLPLLRSSYREKRDVMEQALRRELGDLLQWTQPAGGFFLWATLPRGLDADRLMPRALAERVSYVAGSAFFVESPITNTLRLSFSAPAPDRIVEGVARFARAVRAELGPPSDG